MKRLGFIVLLSILPVSLFGQVVHTHNTIMEEWFKADVTTMSEFRERFNKCVSDGKDSLSYEQRMKGLLSLFNRSSEAINEKQDTVRTFVEYVLEQKPNLSFSDSLWYAEVLCVIKHKGKQHDLRLVLRTEFVDQDIYRWAFCGVNGLHEAGILCDSAFGFIEPLDNDLNFIGMDSRLQKDYKNAFGYQSADSQISQLSIFLYLLQDHQITIEFIDKIKYHFLNIPEYVFIVEHSTTVMNSGWLISDIIVLSNNGKGLYKQALFGIY